MRSKDTITKKHTDFSEEDIESYLQDLKQLVTENAYTIELNTNRTENIDFMEIYNINTEKAKKILLELDVLDFCYAANNTKPEFSHEMLYIFSKELNLDNRGDIETVDIYIKSNIMKTRKGKKRLFIISFHQRKYPITHCFK